jgi:Raf kinase inhibitor-like YbhB/YbcL family protein
MRHAFVVASILTLMGAGGARVSLSLRSPSFAPNEEIPSEFTCEGHDRSPALEWSGIPDGTKTLVLIVDDPDAPDPKAPQRTWVHWVVFNIPASVSSLAEGASSASLPKGVRVGMNDWRKQAYGGPCPPIGRHRYFFKLYALDQVLEIANPTKADLEQAIEGHVLAKAELVGTYQKKQAK